MSGDAYTQGPLLDLLSDMDFNYPAVNLFTALLACADSSGYCSNVYLTAAYLEVYVEPAEELLKVLVEKGYLELHYTPSEYGGTTTDARILKWKGRAWTAIERVPWTEWKAIRDRVLERDNHQCKYCGARGGSVELEVDHVIPISKGGTHEFSNLVTACKDCNLSKHGKVLLEWSGRKTA